MQNPIQKFKQSSIVFEIFENFGEFQLPYSSIIFALTFTRFLLANVGKRMRGIFFILFRPLFTKIEKTWFLHTHLLLFY